MSTNRQGELDALTSRLRFVVVAAVHGEPADDAPAVQVRVVVAQRVALAEDVERLLGARHRYRQRLSGQQADYRQLASTKTRI